MPPSVPPWIGALEHRAGPLAPAACRFLTEHAGAPPPPMPSGVPGLRALARAIDAWAERGDEVSSSDDEAFIEGAGALLGCLVLDHFRGAVHASREGAHRVRIGPYGYFDPFRAIESALEGPTATGVLVEELARAEDEAAGRAGVGRALRLLSERLAARRPDLSVEQHFEQHVVLSDQVELDLSRVVAAGEGEPDGMVRAAIDKLVSMLPGGDGGGLPAWDEIRAALLPRLVSADFAARVAGSDERGRLALRPVLGGALTVALIVGYGDRARYVREDELSRWRVSAEEALRVALANLAARSATARFARVDTSSGPLVLARTGDGLDGARLLLPTLHEVLAPELGSPFLVAAPHRDALWACAVEPPALRAALASRVREDAARAPHRIGDRLFLVTSSGIRPAEALHT